MWKASTRGHVEPPDLFFPLTPCPKQRRTTKPSTQWQGPRGEKQRNVFCSVPSLPFHNKNPFSLAHLLFKFLGPSSRQGRVCVLELSTPFHKWRNRLGGRWAQQVWGRRKDTNCGPKIFATQKYMVCVWIIRMCTKDYPLDIRIEREKPEKNYFCSYTSHFCIT